MTETTSDLKDENVRELGFADVNRVMELLPHRYPMLLIDKIRDMDGCESAVGIKNVTINDPYFQGHFPGHPVFPGVLIVEAMAQTAGALVIHGTAGDAGRKVVYFMAIDKAKFRARRSVGAACVETAEPWICLEVSGNREGRWGSCCRSGLCSHDP